MSELFDTKTRKPTDIENQDDLHNALLSGTASYKKGDRVNVYKPGEEKPGTVTAEKVKDAIAAGWRVETKKTGEIRKYVEENDNIKGSLKVGLGQFADELALGLPELIYDKTQDPFEVAKKDALKKSHAYANLIGGVGGFGAGLFYGAPVFKAAGKVGVKTSEMVARQIAARTAGEVTETAAKKIATQMLAKGVGTGVEGALLASPTAFTEAVLGDPDQAAETLLSGVGIGATFGVGGVLAGKLATKSKEAAASLSERLAAREGMTGMIAKKAAKVLTGVPEDSIKKYLGAPERINAAKSIDEIKDEIDNAYNLLSDKVAVTKEVLKQADDDLGQAYRAVTTDIRQARAPKDVADDLLLALNNEKVKLGEMGMDALEVLENSTASIKTQKIKAIIGQYKSSLKIRTPDTPQGVFMPETLGTVKMLDDMVDSMKQLGRDLPLPEAKKYLKQLDESLEGAYGGAAGSFDVTSDKIRKKIRKSLSDEIKVLSPEYKQIMDEMSPRAQMLDEMSKAFGTPQKALAKINKALKQNGEIENELLTKFSAVQGENWLGKLSDYSKKLDYVERLKRGEDLRQELLPELFKKKQNIELELADNIAAFEPAKALTNKRTQAIIRNQGFKNAYIEDRRALEYLSSRQGKNFAEMIDDRNVLNDFSKESTQGSRKTLLGTVLGDIAGVPILGASIGASTDVYGGVALKKILDRYNRSGGLLFTEQAMKNTALKLDKIPSVLKAMGEKTKRLPSTGTMGIESVRRLLGKPEPSEKEESSRNERAQNIRELGDKLAELSSNPDLLTKKVSELSDFITNEGAPNIGAAFTTKMTEAVNYLMAEIPKPPVVNSPFAPKVVWRPTDYDMNQFEMKVAVALEPMVVFDELQAGTLTTAHIEALKAIYPKTYDTMLTRIQNYAAENPTEMSYDQRLKLSLIMGAAVDPSMEVGAINHLQETWKLGISTDTEETFKAEIDIAGQQMTNEQRLSAKG